MLGPLTETFQVEGVSADSVARSSGIALDYLHMADCTHVILILILFLEDDISARHFNFGILQEFFDFIVMNSAVGDNISKFFIIIFVSKE